MINFENLDFFAPLGGSQQFKILKFCLMFSHFQLKSHFFNPSLSNLDNFWICYTLGDAKTKMVSNFSNFHFWAQNWQKSVKIG